MADKPITIIGGGLAGLTLGIALRERNVPVTIREAGHYPRHKVCGEFISGRARELFAVDGLLGGIADGDSRPARTALFATETSVSRVLTLPQPALCISRHTLDAKLAERFESSGGRLLMNSRWRGDVAEGMVRSSGRVPRAIVRDARWFGAKCHASNVRLEADLELHLSGDGYVGICRLPGDVVNVCGLFRHSPGSDAISSNPLEWLAGPPGSILRQRMDDACVLPESTMTVAGLDLRPRRAAARGECVIGDALTMIPPFTGNGMSMAFESAMLAAGPLERHAHHGVEWRETIRSIARRCDESFAPRLRLAWLLQGLLWRPGGREWMMRLIGAAPWIWRLLFVHTR